MKSLKSLKKPLLWLISPRVLIVSVFVFAGLLAAIYGLISAQKWSSFHTNYQQNLSMIKQNLDTALAMPAVSNDEQTQKIVALEKIPKAIDQVMQCNEGMLFGWQSAYISSLKNWGNECDTQTNRLVTLRSAVNRLTQYVKNEQAMSQILRSPLSINTVTETAITGQEATWHTTVASLTSMPVTGDFSAVKSKAISAVAAIDAAWSALMTATKQQNRQAYMAAEMNLQSAYASFTGVSDQNKVAFATLTSVFQQAYKQAF